MGRGSQGLRCTDRLTTQELAQHKVGNVEMKASPATGQGAEALLRFTYDKLKEAILSNRLRPGSKLGHQLLAEMLGVSRTPVRESLERLSQEGYVTHVANRGYFVAEIDSQEVRDLYQTREALEVYALKQMLARGVTRDLRKKLDQVNAHYKRLCLDSLSRERLLVDRDFHLTLAGGSGNLHLARTLAGIFDRLILKRRVEGFHDTRGLAPYQDHVRLLDALYSGEAAAAEQVLTNHIQSACTRFLGYLDTGTAPLG